MSDTTTQDYAVYRTAAEGDEGAGYVWNRIIWDGSSSWEPPAGSAAVADAANAYPIGSTYTAPASTTT